MTQAEIRARTFWMEIGRMDEIDRASALAHTFYTLGKRGHELVNGSDEDKLNLLEIAGRGTANPMDKLYAEVLLFDPETNKSVELARIRNTSPLPSSNRN